MTIKEILNGFKELPLICKILYILMLIDMFVLFVVIFAFVIWFGTN